MTIEEHPMFAVLEKANRRLRARLEFYKAAKEKYGEDHSLARSAKKAVEEATKELADATDKL